MCFLQWWLCCVVMMLSWFVKGTISPSWNWFSRFADSTPNVSCINFHFMFAVLYESVLYHNVSYIIFAISATIRDSGNMTHTIRNLKITMRDMNQHPPQPTLAKKMMNEAVCNALPASNDNNRTNIMTVGDYDLQISGTFASYV